MVRQKPSYLKTYQSGELQNKIKKLSQILNHCSLCPRSCGVNRLRGEVGYCKAGAELKVASAFPHFGEEHPLVAKRGSGTIFLSHCNLLCMFCQNYEISHLGEGKTVTSGDFARIMIYLQSQGCHNINFVTPTHYVPQIMAALPAAIEMGLNIPIVYNCGGYESIEVIKLLEGIVDIYMPDIKFSDSKKARKYANAPNYFRVTKLVLKEMHRQVGVLKIDEKGIAFRGLLIRHLVMPDDVDGSEKILTFIAKELSTESYVNIMAQYRPCYNALYDANISRPITENEYHKVIHFAREIGLKRGF